VLFVNSDNAVMESGIIEMPFSWMIRIVEPEGDLRLTSKQLKFKRSSVLFWLQCCFSEKTVLWETLAKFFGNYLLIFSDFKTAV